MITDEPHAKAKHPGGQVRPLSAALTPIVIVPVASATNLNEAELTAQHVSEAVSALSLYSGTFDATLKANFPLQHDLTLRVRTASVTTPQGQPVPSGTAVVTILPNNPVIPMTGDPATELAHSTVFVAATRPVVITLFADVPTEPGIQGNAGAVGVTQVQS